LSVGHTSLLFSTSTAGKRGRKKGERPRMAPLMAFTRLSAKESVWRHEMHTTRVCVSVYMCEHGLQLRCANTDHGHKHEREK
jgi:hypothetical protein